MVTESKQYKYGYCAQQSICEGNRIFRKLLKYLKKTINLQPTGKEKELQTHAEKIHFVVIQFYLPSATVHLANYVKRMQCSAEGRSRALFCNL
jgi:hypothetical protein